MDVLDTPSWRIVKSKDNDIDDLAVFQHEQKDLSQKPWLGELTV